MCNLTQRLLSSVPLIIVMYMINKNASKKCVCFGHFVQQISLFYPFYNLVRIPDLLDLLALV